MEARRNPFTASSTGGRVLSGLQLPFFLARPPAGYGVLTTTGRRTGKTRRRCIRALPSGQAVYLVAIKGLARSGWAKNALAADTVQVRLPSGVVRGRARKLDDPSEVARARAVYAGTVHWFDYLTWLNWRRGRPSRARIEQLLADWVDTGTPLIIEPEQTPGTR